MHHKRYPHLAGLTGVQDLLAGTTEASRFAPQVPFAAGTKAPSRGEPVTFEQQGRMFGELARSLDIMAQVFDAPTVREDRVEADNGTYGCDGLQGVALGQEIVSLGSGSAPVAVWLYHGLFQTELRRFMRLVRNYADNDMTDAQAEFPADVHIGGTGTSVFPAGVLSQGSPFSGMPSAASFMRRIAPPFAPYSGSTIAATIDSWDTDGPRLSANLWSELYARPGVFVEVAGSTYNDGVYRLVQVAHREGVPNTGKGVLVNAGLHKLTLDSPLTVGTRISWSLPPNQAVSGVASNTMYGYVMYVSGDDHYVLMASGSDQFPIPAVGALGVDAIGSFAGRLGAGTVGSQDREASNDRNSGLLVGTTVTDSLGATANVTAVVAAGEATTFRLDGAAAGALYILNPPGFCLSPDLDFGINSNLIGGDYTLECRTLTTVAERLFSAEGTTQGGGEDPAFDMKFSRAEYDMLLRALKYYRVGNQADSVSEFSGPSGPYAPSYAVLGETRWRVTMVNDTDTDTFDVHASPGDLISFTAPAYGTNVVLAEVVSVSGNVVVFDRVRRYLDTGTWNPAAAGGAKLNEDPLLDGILTVASTVNLAGRDFYIDSIDHKPGLAEQSGATVVLPESMLSALYRNLLHAHSELRSSAFGKWLKMDDGNPMELMLDGTGTGQGALRVWGVTDDYDAIAARDQSPTNTNHTLQLQVDADEGVVLGTDPSYPTFFLGNAAPFASGPGAAVTKQALLDFSAGVLSFADQNTGLGSAVPLTSAAPYNALPSFAGSVLEALHRLVIGGTVAAQSYSVVSPSWIYSENGVVAEHGHSLAAGSGTLTPNYLADLSRFQSSVAHGLAGGEIIRIYSTDSDGIPSYEYHEVSAIHSLTDFSVSGSWAGASNDPVSDWAVVTDPLNVDVPEGAAILGGLNTPYAAATLVMPASSTRIITVNDSGVVALAAGDPTLIQNLVPLARVVSNAYAVVTVEPLALKSAAIDLKTDIFVGALGGLFDLNDQGVHFNTIGEAFKAIERWEASGASRVQNSWRIHVAGDCVEADDLDKGITLPLKVPADNVTILSAGIPGTDGTTGPEVTWGVQTSLFETNAKSGFSIIGLSARYTGSFSLSADRVRTSGSSELCLVSNTLTTGQGLSGLLLDRCHVRGAGLLSLRQVSGGSNISLVRSSTTEAPGAGLYLNTSGQLKAVSVVDCLFTSTQANVAGGEWQSSLFCVDSAYELSIRGCHFYTSDANNLPFLLTGAGGRVRSEGCTFIGLNTSAVFVFDADDDLSAEFVGCRAEAGDSGAYTVSPLTVANAQGRIAFVNCTAVATAASALGFRTSAPNTQFSNCAYFEAAGVTAGDGFWIISTAANCTLSGCYSETDIRVDADHCRLTNCEAGDLEVNNCSYVTARGCRLQTLSADGVDMLSLEGSYINGLLDMQNGGSLKHASIVGCVIGQVTGDVDSPASLASTRVQGTCALPALEVVAAGCRFVGNFSAGEQAQLSGCRFTNDCTAGASAHISGCRVGGTLDYGPSSHINGNDVGTINGGANSAGVANTAAALGGGHNSLLVTNTGPAGI